MPRRWLIIPVAVLVFCAGPACAQEKPEWRSWPMGQRVGIKFGSFFANMETEVRVDSSDGTFGTGISFERDLGLDDSKTRPMASAYWRFAKKHRLNFYYFNLDRSGDSISSVNIRFGDQTFQANLPLQAFFDVEIYNIGYSYSILFDAKKELSLGVALSFQDIAIGLQGTVQGQPREVSGTKSVLAPLPTVTGRFAYAITPKWIVDTGIGYFTLEVDTGGGELNGDVIAANAGVRWQLLKHFHLGLLYQWFRVDVNTKGDVRQADFLYTYDGPLFYLGTSF
jgi:hypothetical protein